jgi:hypothetical protein
MQRFPNMRITPFWALTTCLVTALSVGSFPTNAVAVAALQSPIQIAQPISSPVHKGDICHRGSGRLVPIYTNLSNLSA